MISIKRLGKDLKKVSDYYLKEDKDDSLSEIVSSEDGDHPVETSQWLGELRTELGISGKVDEETLGKVLDGELPNGEALGRMRGGKREHHSGWDLTFNAPKSVSVMALVAGDARLIKAHQLAVKKTLQFITEHSLVTRQSINGEIINQKVQQSLAATFLQTRSRNDDPHLHTHMLLMNVTKRADGQWRSLETEPTYHALRTAGSYYRSVLAQQTKSLGYEIEVDRKSGYFEIPSVPKKLLDYWSSRNREDLASAKEAYGFRTPKGYDQAVIHSRKNKSDLSFGEARRGWHHHLEDQSVDLESVKSRSQERADQTKRGGNKTISDEIPKTEMQPSGHQRSPAESLASLLEKAYNTPSKSLIEQGKEVIRGWRDPNSGDDPVTMAYKSLNEREAAFTKDALIEAAIKASMGSLDPEMILRKVSQLEEEGAIIPAIVTKNGKPLPAYTTPQSVRDELTISRLLDKGKRELEPIYPDKRFNQLPDWLTSGQREAIEMAATTSDRVSVIQGFAGTGKTTMLTLLNELMNQKSQIMLGFAPSGSATEKLYEETGIASKTVDSFLYQMRHHKKQGTLPDYSNTTWVVDESSMLSSRQWIELLRYSRFTNSRIISVGDRLQMPSVEAGRPMIQAQKSGVDVAKMEQIQRQKESPELLKSIELSIQREYERALKQIDKSTFENRDSEVLITRLIADYLGQNQSDRAKSMIIIPDHETRYRVNRSIQKALIDSGEIATKSTSLQHSVNLNLTQEEKRMPQSYQPGMVIDFHYSQWMNGIKAGDRWTVKESKKGCLILINQQGKTIEWNPSSLPKDSGLSADVYQLKSIELHQGDSIVWRRTNQKLGIKNGARGHVVALEGEMATIQFEREKRVVDLKWHTTWDLAYATTTYQSQGLDRQNVFYLAESWRKNLVNATSFLTSQTRAKRRLNLYTDSKEGLVGALKSRLGQKESALASLKLNKKGLNEWLSGSVKSGQDIKDDRTEELQRVQRVVRNKVRELLLRRKDNQNNRPVKKVERSREMDR